MKSLWSARKSLRVIIGGNFFLLAVIIAALSTFLIFVSEQNRTALHTKQDLNYKLYGALELKSAIDDMLYFSAELSNSLTDASLDNFEGAVARAENEISQLSDQELQNLLRRYKSKIVEHATAALESYVIGERAGGDLHMAQLRVNALLLKAETAQRLVQFQALATIENEKILARTRSVEQAALFVAFASTGLLLLLGAILWKTLLSPFMRLIEAVSNAAANPRNAIDYKVDYVSRNEMGLAMRAFNGLLTSVSSSIREADQRAEEAQQANARWKALFNESPDAIILLDPVTTQVLDFNPATEKLFGNQASGGKLAFCKDITGLELHHHEIEAFESFLDAIMVRGYARSDTLRCAVGEEFVPVSAVGVPVPHRDGTVVLLYVRDISEQQQHADELNRALQAAEKANDAKANFLANMSHEIRTPMNGIMGMAEILEGTELSKRQKGFVQIIQKSSSALLDIINDVLDFSKIDAGQLVLNEDPFNLKNIAEDVVSMMAVKAEEKTVELILRFQPDLPESFLGDEGRMRQILVNLVGNAVKFTEVGHVLLDISGEVDGDQIALNVRVEDTGIGIPPENLHDVFKKFNQVDNSATRKYEGTGLGLAICKMLLEKMGGDIRVDSQLNQGTCFEFSVNLRALADSNVERPAQFQIRGSRALVVDDNQVNRNILDEQLKSWGVDVACFDRAEALLSYVRDENNNPSSVDFVIMDFQMPGVDGVTASEELKSLTALKDAAVILLTSVGDDRSNKEYHAAGIDQAISKPARSSELLEAILSGLSRRKIRGANAALGAPGDRTKSDESPVAEEVGLVWSATGEPLRVLVVEDNATNQLVVGAYLKKAGAEFKIADNGKTGVEKTRSFEPHIVLMDISMPIMNGYDATAKIRQLNNKFAQDLVIIGLTANALPGDRQKCIAAGMDDYLSKPLQQATLVSCIEKWNAAKDRDGFSRIVSAQ